MSNTSDLSKFGYKEIDKLIAILFALKRHGLPDNFELEGVGALFNMSSGEVFLANDEMQSVLMTDNGKLEEWHHCSYCGHEGFKEDFEHEAQSEECVTNISWVKEVE